MNYKNYIEKNNILLPSHIAIIMDGNGRWAKKNQLLRIDGHRKGVKIVKKITEICGQIGIKKLTLYTFSSENWKRPKKEISALMKLLSTTIKKEVDNLNQNNVRFTIIGDIDALPDEVSNSLKNAIKVTAHNEGLNLNLAVNYGGRQEIASICKDIADEYKKDKIDIEAITEDYINKKILNDKFEPDLLIRTGGEFRISNFMLWQIAYSELYVTKKCWPEFKVSDFIDSIIEFNNRERRFGKISEQIT